MKVNQLYTNCLAQGAYYIAHKGEAVIIDPLRETEPYLKILKENGDKLKYIFETHFHADFVSGHVDLAKKTGATIVFGPNANTDYKSYVAKDNEEFKIGDLTLRVLHTPGHTLESSSFLLLDENGKPQSIFTGDTLFIGDVGRPDLAIKSDLTQEDLAGMLFDSLRTKIMNLPDEVIVYPAHGAGSACGKNMSKETFDTLGNQKKTNYALQNISKEEFIKELTTGILPPPQYFSKNAMLNKGGYKEFDSVLESGVRPLSPAEFEEKAKEKNVLILDVRKAADFAKSHVPNSLFIGLDGQFAPWVGTIIEDLNTPILIVTPEGKEEEAVMRLSRVGYDNSIGFLEGGIEAWKNAGKKTEQIISITANEFAQRAKNSKINILDVRRPGEHEAQHLENVSNKPLDFIVDWHVTLDKEKEHYIHCAGGYRSMIASSILKRNGFKNLIDVEGGFSAIAKTDLPTTSFVCPSKKV
ncbi:MAG: MBL fold metallo-hydrolase [Sphingobacteriaceae bacterium]|nr:MBL fold metallo-hydrolase [Sphingobacteriaceae bacterium]